MTDTENWGEPRTRTITWFDPAVLARAAATRSGLEFLQAIGRGELPPPPISSLFEMELDEIVEGRVAFRCTPRESAYNPIGAVHGGLVCTLLDSVLGCAVHTTLPAGFGYTSIEIKVSYLRGVTAASGELTATGRVTKPGRRVAFADGEVVDAAGKIVATSSSSLLVFPMPG